ncbi:hypothetical protein NMD07_19790 [Citrobacter cronae]|uniref:hypothetical protein n=1 Tax=Citrobacter cronae TaxID=1748967 RepID=UPI00351CF25F
MQNGNKITVNRIVIVTHNAYCYFALESLIDSLYGRNIITEWKKDILAINKKKSDKKKTIVIFADFPYLNYNNYLHLCLIPHFFNVAFICDIISRQNYNCYTIWSKSTLNDLLNELRNLIAGK